MYIAHTAASQRQQLTHTNNNNNECTKSANPRDPI